MKKILSIIMIVLILAAALSPMALATGGSGTATLNLTKPDTGVTDQNLLKPIDTPYPPSLNMLFLIIGAAIVITIGVIVAKKLIKKHRSKHRDIYGRW